MLYTIVNLYDVFCKDSCFENDRNSKSIEKKLPQTFFSTNPYDFLR